ncbi:phage gp6-like head-tail connector protein [Luteimonas sp. XNQY3]|nr:head-tail connector protein [Luteimonas sp. XNQY3]MCD9005226.1 phage gp6-like head-tail connector protein [Luteimonas sp. XNQY3]
MGEFVTLEDAHTQLRTSADDDPWLALWIPAASAAVEAWLKQPWRCYKLQIDAVGLPMIGEEGVPLPVLDEEGKPVVHPLVRSAVLVELAAQYRFRDSEGAPVVEPSAGHGYVLSQGATALLAPLRKSTVA